MWLEKKLSIIKLMESNGFSRYGRMDGDIYFHYEKMQLMAINTEYCTCCSRIQYSKYCDCYVREDFSVRVYHIEREYEKIMEWIEEIKLSIKEAQGYKKKIEIMRDFE